MKKTIVVMATIKIEGENLNDSCIKKILKRIQKYFLYKFKYEDDNSVIVGYQISDNFVEINK